MAAVGWDPPEAWPIAPPGMRIPVALWGMAAEAPAAFGVPSNSGMPGQVCIGPRGRGLPQLATRLKQIAAATPGQFFLPAESDAVRGYYTCRSTLFPIAPGFYIGIVPESTRVRPKSPFRLLLVVVNVAGTGQARRVEGAHFPASRAERARLHFSLPPVSWSFKEFLLNARMARDKPKRIKIVIRSYSDRNPYAKSLAIAAATGGLVTKTPGYKLISTAVFAMDLESVDRVRTLSQQCAQVGNAWFDARRARSILSADGRLIAREEAMNWFSEFLTMGRVIGGFQKYGWQNAPAGLWQDFMACQVGGIAGLQG